jgi:sorting nexin-29
LNVHDVSDVSQIEIHTAEQLIPGPSHLEVEISNEKLKKYKSLGSDQIAAELYQAGVEILVSVIHKLITSIWNEEVMPDLWNESIIVPIHKRVIKLTNNYCGISLLSISYKMLSNIFPSRLSPYIDEIIGDHQCGFRRNRKTTDQIFCIRQILEKVGVQ